jgi:hypothetical protein
MLISSTGWAGKSLGPAPSKKGLAALALSSVEPVKISIAHTFLKLHRITRHLRLLCLLKDIAKTIACQEAEKGW